MSLGIVSKIVLGIVLVIVIIAILFYLKVFIKNLENENREILNKEEMAIGRERGGGNP